MSCNKIHPKYLHFPKLCSRCSRRPCSKCGPCCRPSPTLLIQRTYKNFFFWKTEETRHIQKSYVRFQVLTTTFLNMAVFWDVAQGSLISSEMFHRTVLCLFRTCSYMYFPVRFTQRPEDGNNNNL